jgi:hypothetical protein
MSQQQQSTEGRWCALQSERGSALTEMVLLVSLVILIAFGSVSKLGFMVDSNLHSAANGFDSGAGFVAALLPGATQGYQASLNSP